MLCDGARMRGGAPYATVTLSRAFWGACIWAVIVLLVEVLTCSSCVGGVQAKQTQEALSAIRENFVSKLASIAAAASGKLGEGAPLCAS